MKNLTGLKTELTEKDLERKSIRETVPLGTNSQSLKELVNLYGENAVLHVNHIPYEGSEIYIEYKKLETDQDYNDRIATLKEKVAYNVGIETTKRRELYEELRKQFG